MAWKGVQKKELRRQSSGERHWGRQNAATGIPFPGSQLSSGINFFTESEQVIPSFPGPGLLYEAVRSGGSPGHLSRPSTHELVESAGEQQWSRRGERRERQHMQALTHSRSATGKERVNELVWRGHQQGQVHERPLHCGGKKSKMTKHVSNFHRNI